VPIQSPPHWASSGAWSNDGDLELISKHSMVVDVSKQLLVKYTMNLTETGNRELRPNEALSNFQQKQGHLKTEKQERLPALTHIEITSEYLLLE
jgi:hypothetical protein